MNLTSTSTWPTGVAAILSALNIFLSITASLGDALILVALHKESSLHPSANYLTRSKTVKIAVVFLDIQPKVYGGGMALIQRSCFYTAISIYCVGSKLQAYATRPNGSAGRS